MTHRPYPSIDRAVHQLDRHGDETPPYREPRPMTTFERQIVEGATAAVKRAEPVLARMVAGMQKRPVGSEEKNA